MALKLAVANRIGIKVEGNTTDEEGTAKPFRFILVCDRLPHLEVKGHLEDKAGTTTEFFKKHARDWKEQQLVLDEDDKPAAFSDAALDVLLQIAGMPNACWQAYIAQVVVTAKN